MSRCAHGKNFTNRKMLCYTEYHSLVAERPAESGSSFSAVFPSYRKREVVQTEIGIIRCHQIDDICLGIMDFRIVSQTGAELAGSAAAWPIKKFFTIVFSNKLYCAVFLIFLMVVFVKGIDLVFKFFQKKNSIHMSFLKGILQALVIVSFVLQIGSLSDTFSKFYSSILMSSSLIVVVLGFVFQEGLSNIVHGFMLILFKPFELGDRIKIIIDGQQLTGYVKTINLRNTVIQNITNNSFVIIPNAKMDLCIIDNSYFDADALNSNFLDASITYESNLEKACSIMSECITHHPLVQKARKTGEKDTPVNVMVYVLADSGIGLRASVVTKTIEENFLACSDIRKELLHRFSQEADVDFAYPHMVVKSASDEQHLEGG